MSSIRLVVVDDHSSAWDVILPKSLPVSLPGIESQSRISALADGPAVSHLADVSDDRDQVSLSCLTSEQKFGEISAGDRSAELTSKPRTTDLLELCHQIDPPASSADDPANTTWLRCRKRQLCTKPFTT